MPATPNATAPIMLPELAIKSFTAELHPVWKAFPGVHAAESLPQQEGRITTPQSDGRSIPQHSS